MARPKKNPVQNESAPVGVANEAAPGNERMAALEAQNAQLAEQVKSLMAALVGTRLQPEVAEEAELIEATNVSGSALTATLDNNGHPRTFLWEGRGVSHKLTRKQLQELFDKAPHFFEKGYISAPGFIDDNANVIHNVQRFLDTLTPENLQSRLDAITSIDTLYLLYHHIENSRFAEEAVKDTSGELVLPEVQINPLIMALQLGIAKKLNVLANVDVSLSM